MPMWVVAEEPDMLSLSYIQNDSRFECGKASKLTDIRMILSWVIEEAKPFDVIRLDNRDFVLLRCHTGTV